MTPILAFDIETVPDIAGLRLLHGIEAQISDHDVAEFAFRERRARTGHDFLPLHQHRVVAIACAPRDEVARLLGFPGKLGMDGSKVWEAYQSGKIDDIRKYCETDVANTYLVFQRFQLLRGACDEALYRRELELVRDTLAHSKESHWREFVGRWS